MKGKLTIAILAVLAGGLAFPDRQSLARDFVDGPFAKAATQSVSRNRTVGWIRLRRPDGEIVHVNVEQILFVANAKNTGANERARSRVQLVNGFADVLETVDEVMQSIKSDYSPGVATTGAVFNKMMNSSGTLERSD
jgi:hypothetical protein